MFNFNVNGKGFRKLLRWSLQQQLQLKAVNYCFKALHQELIWGYLLRPYTTLLTFLPFLFTTYPIFYY